MDTATDAALRLPLLVGIGVATRREDDFRNALEPVDLMREAVDAAGRDCGAPALLRDIGYIAVPRGRWTYNNPAGAIARHIGATHATTVLATVGVLQQTLIGEACARIARGESEAALVVGADAGYRLLRAQIAGLRPPEADTGDLAPHLTLAPKDELRHPVETRAGMKMPVGLYAILESAYRARHGWTIDEHRDRIARLYERFSRIASDNPHAWNRTAMSAEQIRDASPKNPMQAFPYTRAHCSTWNVDQAAALLFCSKAKADALGIPLSRRIHVAASTESNHMVAVSARADLASCPGAGIAGRGALDAARLQAAEIDLIDLYSCFPIAVETYADALGLDPLRDLTVTGGMAFAGGPYNNYVLQATARAALLLRAGKGRNALVSSVSGVLTKQAFGVYSIEPPAAGFVHRDMTDQVAREVKSLDVREDYSGDATVAGCTVLHSRNEPVRAVALVDTADGARAMATSDDPELARRMEQEEFVGRRVRVDDNRLFA